FAFFSPDGQWIGFRSGSKLNKISIEGGAVVPLADQTMNAGWNWAEDGNIIAGGALTGGLHQIPSGGGAAVALTELKGEIAHALPHVLPGGKAVLFAAYSALDGDKA